MLVNYGHLGHGKGMAHLLFRDLELSIFDNHLHASIDRQVLLVRFSILAEQGLETHLVIAENNLHWRLPKLFVPIFLTTEADFSVEGLQLILDEHVQSSRVGDCVVIFFFFISHHLCPDLDLGFAFSIRSMHRLHLPVDDTLISVEKASNAEDCFHKNATAHDVASTHLQIAQATCLVLDAGLSDYTVNGITHKRFLVNFFELVDPVLHDVLDTN